MLKHIDEVCIRLKWYLRLCEDYLRTNTTTEKFDQYIIRYIVIGLRSLISSNYTIYTDVGNICSSNLLKYLDELGLQFLYARYSYVDDFSILSFLKLFCPCLSKVVDLRC